MAVRDFGLSMLGTPIEVLSADTRNRPDVAGSIAREWYYAGVDVIVDLPVTPVAAALQQLAREKGRAVMIAAAVATDLTAKTCTPWGWKRRRAPHSVLVSTGTRATRTTAACCTI